MKKGDKVRFLSEVGGGKVAGFQGKNIVLVEDEDGFEIPMPINEVVVVEQDEYSMGKMISAKMDAQVVFALLVEGDISSQEGCLRQAININFLCERQVFETLQLITEHLDIGKSLLSVYITFCHFYLYLPCKSNTFFPHTKLFLLFFALCKVFYLKYALFLRENFYLCRLFITFA
jgi:hypothetical protein